MCTLGVFGWMAIIWGALGISFGLIMDHFRKSAQRGWEESLERERDFALKTKKAWDELLERSRQEYN